MSFSLRFSKYSKFSLIYGFLSNFKGLSLIIDISPRLTNFSFKDIPQFHFRLAVDIIYFETAFLKDPFCQYAHLSIFL